MCSLVRPWVKFKPIAGAKVLVFFILQNKLISNGLGPYELSMPNLSFPLSLKSNCGGGGSLCPGPKIYIYPS